MSTINPLRDFSRSYLHTTFAGSIIQNMLPEREKLRSEIKAARMMQAVNFLRQVLMPLVSQGGKITDDWAKESL